MKQVILLFLLLPIFLPAQTGWSELDTVLPGAIAIQLPKTKSTLYLGNEFIITNAADYKSLFPDSINKELPKIDFTRYELLAKSYCSYCFRCLQPQCHRNACNYSRSWFLLEKRRKIKLTSDMLDGSNCSFFPVFVNSFISRDDSSFSILQGSCAALKNDTIDFNEQIVVARKKYLDCAAHVEHEFYLDTAGRCVVWRLYSAYGGCHVMNEKSFIFALPKPPPGYAIRLEEYTLPFED